MKTLLYLLRILLGALFVWSGLIKFRQPYEFLSAVYAYQLVGPDTGIVIAATLPWLEMILGGCLLTGVITEGALLGTVGLCGMFAAAITVDWYRGLAITCGCFGSASETISSYSVARSWLLLLVALAALRIASRLRIPIVPRSPVRSKAEPIEQQRSPAGALASQSQQHGLTRSARKRHCPNPVEAQGHPMRVG